LNEKSFFRKTQNFSSATGVAGFSYFTGEYSDSSNNFISWINRQTAIFSASFGFINSDVLNVLVNRFKNKRLQFVSGQLKYRSIAVKCELFLSLLR